MDYVYIKTGRPADAPKEILMANASITLPEGVPVGSVAYTADLSYMAMYNGETWTQIGGGA